MRQVHTSRSRRPAALGAALAVLAAVTCLVLITITGLASAPHQAPRLSSGAPLWAWAGLPDVEPVLVQAG